MVLKKKQDLFLFLEKVIFVGWYFWIDPENDLMVDSKKTSTTFESLDLLGMWCFFHWFSQALTHNQSKLLRTSMIYRKELWSNLSETRISGILDGFLQAPWNRDKENSNIRNLSCPSLRKEIARDSWREFFKNYDAFLQILNLWTRS